MSGASGFERQPAVLESGSWLGVCLCDQKSVAVTLLGVGFSITAWLLQYLWQNVEELLSRYSYYVAIYFVTAGIISFAVCYYRGPVTNPRLLDLIRWSIQLLAIALIYYSSQIAEVSATIIALVVMVSVIPRRFYMLGVPSFITRFWYMWNDELLLSTTRWCVLLASSASCGLFLHTAWHSIVCVCLSVLVTRMSSAKSDWADWDAIWGGKTCLVHRNHVLDGGTYGCKLVNTINGPCSKVMWAVAFLYNCHLTFLSVQCGHNNTAYARQCKVTRNIRLQMRCIAMMIICLRSCHLI